VIPVLVVPCLVRFDLLARLLDTLDEPVERIVVIDNSLNGWSDQRCDVIYPISGLGYEGGLNAGIMQTPSAPWWLVCNDDIAFGARDLRSIAERIEAARGPCVVTGSRNDGRLLRLAYGAINRACIERVGLFDDGFYPIYFGDDDYQRRCELAGVEWVEYDGLILHGEHGDAGSMTIKSDANAAAANSRTFMLNRDRYVAKWGGPPGGEVYDTPWDSGAPLSWWPIDMAGRAARTW